MLCLSLPISLNASFLPIVIHPKELLPSPHHQCHPSRTILKKTKRWKDRCHSTPFSQALMAALCTTRFLSTYGSFSKLNGAGRWQALRVHIICHFSKVHVHLYIYIQCSYHHYHYININKLSLSLSLLSLLFWLHIYVYVSISEHLCLWQHCVSYVNWSNGSTIKTNSYWRLIELVWKKCNGRWIAAPWTYTVPTWKQI